ncbi:MAG: iron dicitrate transport regulator FecR [Alphaproteobacteria bacterium]|nr:MAG: iron dicitrate transport regulator FecR [Alphaproteobacteria bacterium]
MYQEAQEAHSKVQLQLISNKQQIETLVERLHRKPPSLVMTCARGSSDHAATYAKYLIETHIGTPTLSAAPSINSVFAARQNLNDVLFLAISQSGQSPDILSAAQAAKDRGAFVVSLINDITSPLAELSDVVIPLHAGPEKSVAATKSFICSLSAIVHLVAAWAQNQSLMKELNNLPDALEKTFTLNWYTGIGVLKDARNLFVISRGFGLGIAQEAALKFKETCGLHAEAFSAAEVKHGPMTIVKKGFPVLIFSVQDQTQSSIDDAATAFIERSAQVLSVGQSYDGAQNLDTAFSAAAELRPIVFIQSFYKFVNALSLTRGYNPDCPPYLNKVTETL